MATDDNCLRAPAANIKLACLDMAGSTVSDEGLVDEAFHAAMAVAGIVSGSERHGAAIEYVRRTMGQSKIEVFNALLRGDRRAAAAANEAFEDAYRSILLEGRVGPIPGAEEAIDTLRARGVNVCLTSGFSPATRDAVISALGWAEHVDLAVSPADCGRGRPYPDMILHAVIRLRIDDVAQVAVVGDTASDLLAGHRSGAAIVAGVLTGAHDRDHLVAAPHTHLLASVADLPGLLFDTDLFEPRVVRHGAVRYGNAHREGDLIVNPRRKKHFVAAAVVLSLGAAACGSSSPSKASATGTGAPSTSKAAAVDPSKATSLADFGGMAQLVAAAQKEGTLNTITLPAGGDFKAAYRRIAERRGRNIAKVAAARKLLTLVYYGLRDGEIRCLAPATPR